MYIYLFIFFICIIFLLFEALCKLTGDCNLNIPEIKDKTFYKSNDEIFLSFDVPFVNSGKQQAIVIDCSLNIQPEGNKYDKFNILSSIINPELPEYPDGYVEAFLVKPGKEVLLNCRVVFSLKEGSIDFTDLPEDMYFEFSYKYYGRSPMSYERKELYFSRDGFKQSEKPAQDVKKDIPGSPRQGNELFTTIPVKTHILRSKDNIMDILNKYIIPLSQKGDVVAIAESVVAILQNRAIYIEDIKPGYFATRLNRFFKQDASLSSPYSLEMAIREVGTWRILSAFVIGTLGKFIGRSGDFYRISGRLAATIDDPPGTMPPFDKCVVLGPKEPKKLVEEIKKHTGLDATIVDANDLGKVDVLASTLDDNDVIVKALRHNPQGNADEQTPIVIIRVKK